MKTTRLRPSLSACAVTLLLTACAGRTGLETGPGQDGSVQQTGSGTGAGPNGCGYAKVTTLATVQPRGESTYTLWEGGFTVAGGYVYIGANANMDPHTPVVEPISLIQRVKTTGGKLEDVTPVIDQYAGGSLTNDGTFLYYARSPTGIPNPPTTVPARRPLAGGPEEILSMPVPQQVVNDVAATTNGVVWVGSKKIQPVVAEIEEWNGSESTMLGAVDANSWQIAVVGDTVFTAANVALSATPLAGGKPTTLKSFDETVRLLSTNATSLFYSPSFATVVRRDVPSGAEKTLLTSFISGWGAYSDSEFLYLGDDDGITRVSVDGGAPELIVSDFAVFAIADDECNLYWVSRGTAGDDNLVIRAVAKPL